MGIKASSSSWSWACQLFTRFDVNSGKGLVISTWRLVIKKSFLSYQITIGAKLHFYENKISFLVVETTMYKPILRLVWADTLLILHLIWRKELISLFYLHVYFHVAVFHFSAAKMLFDRKGIHNFRRKLWKEWKAFWALSRSPALTLMMTS